MSRPSIDRFQSATDRARRQTEAHTKRLADQYATVIRKAGRRASRRFKTTARLAAFERLVAAGEKLPNWAVPPVDDLLDVVQVTQDLLGATEETRKAAATSAVRPITSTMGVSFSLEAPLVKDLTAQAGARAAKLSIPGLRDVVYAAIKQAFEEGLSVDQTAALIYDKADHLAGYQAEMLARTDLIGTANGGSLLAAKAVWPQGGIVKRWVNATDSNTVNDGRIRPTHMEANGQEVPIDGHFIVGGARMLYPGDPAGPDEEVCNCFPAETLVRMPALRAVTRRWYEGDLVRVRLSSGDMLSGTPNHPVLRADGQWTALALLNIGDDLVRADIGGRDAGTPYEDDVVAEIGEVYRLAEIAGDSERVGGAPPYFHGDGSHEKIDVVSVDGSLLLDTEAATDEEVAELGLTLADHARAAASGGYGSTPITRANDRDLTSATCGVRTSDELRALGLIESAHADAVRFAGGANLETERDETTRNCGTGNAERSTHSENALAASVSLAEIVHIDRYAFSGYVYNLDTGEGWYAAESIIAANCRCTLVYHDTVTATAWDETKHSRYPKGTRVSGREGGGRFAPRAAPAATAVLESPIEHIAVDPELERRVRNEDWNTYNVLALQQAAERDGFPATPEGADQWIATLQERLPDAVDNTIVTIRTPDELMDEIVADGRFKSQFESGTSGGALNPELRSEAERQLFGYEPDMTQPQDRPIYGYLARPGGRFKDSATSQYGDIRWELKPSVRARTTWTGGDSLGKTLIPSTLTEPSYLSLPAPSRLSPEAQAEYIAQQKPVEYTTHVSAPLDGAALYAEAQIHGGVTLDDVDAVVIPASYERYSDDHPVKQAAAALAARGISVEYSDV